MGESISITAVVRPQAIEKVLHIGDHQTEFPMGDLCACVPTERYNTSWNISWEGVKNSDECLRVGGASTGL